MSPRVGLPFLGRAGDHRTRTAIAHRAGEHSYDELLRASAATSAALRAAAGDVGVHDDVGARGERVEGDGRGRGDAVDAGDLGEARVAFLTSPGLPYVAALWGIWRAGGVALPLCASHPPRELAHVLDDAGVGLVLTGPSFAARLEPLARERGIPLLGAGEARAQSARGRARAGGAGEVVGRAAGPETARAGPATEEPGAADEARGAMILYTSGTTSRPKGVLHTHRSLRAQVESLVEAWAWGPDDRILHVLPLHHTHGIVNALLCALWSGAACEMLPGFDAEGVWERFAAGAAGKRPPVTLFMAVPTIYVKLIAAWEAAPEERRAAWSAGAGSLRLMVSGSAALPERTFRRWREITGHDLLERYGMTEIGMALSNPLDGERRPGTVGRPLPGVRLRLTDEGGETLAHDEGPPRGEGAEAGGEPEASRRDPPPDAGPGEIRVRGPTLFREYWGRPEATAAAFEGGWFRTGDVATIEGGYWRILGRSSTDIIKSGGYKISALEIEDVLRAHPGVADCAVVGLPDPEWGERVAAAVVVAESPGEGAASGGARPASPGGGAVGEVKLRESLDAWARERLAGYKVPRRWLLVDRLPRNALGKVTKPDLRTLFGGAREGGA